MHSYLKRKCYDVSSNLYNESTITKDINIFIRNYVKPKKKSGKIEIEEDYSALLLDLEIISSKKLKSSTNSYQKQKIRKRFRARAGIEPIIGHVKHDHRMERNYLSGVIGDQINTILAATGFNLIKKLRKIKEELFVFILKLIRRTDNQIQIIIKSYSFRKYGFFRID